MKKCLYCNEKISNAAYSYRKSCNGIRCVSGYVIAVRLGSKEFYVLNSEFVGNPIFTIKGKEIFLRRGKWLFGSMVKSDEKYHICISEGKYEKDILDVSYDFTKKDIKNMLLAIDIIQKIRKTGPRLMTELVKKT